MFDPSNNNNDDLCSQIWDYLYSASGQKSLDEIAQHVNCDRHTIEQAVNHEWFDVTGDVVAIARRGCSSHK